MATATQSDPIQGLDAEKRSGASRQFAGTQRQNIGSEDEEAVRPWRRTCRWKRI